MATLLVTRVAVKGGEGSGNFGHAGRPGQVGGSAPSKFGDAADALNSAPIDKASASARWRKANQARYESDRDFKTLVDVVSLYAQGDYDAVRIFSEYVVTGNVHPDLEGSMYPIWIAKDAPMTVIAHPLAEHKSYFAGQEFGQDMADVSVTEAAAVLQRAIADSKPLDVPIYRGVAVHKTYVPDGPKDPDGFQNYHFEDTRIPKVGETFDIVGTSSFTADDLDAKAFAAGTARGQRPSQRERAEEAQYLAVYEIEPGAHGVNASPVSPWNQKEVITSGRFEVVGVEEYDTFVYTPARRYTTREMVPGYRIKLRQVGVWDVDPNQYKGKPDQKN